MIFDWFRKKRRARITAVPFPDIWQRIISTNVVHEGQLNDEQRQKLQRLIQVFVTEKNWEGCGGLTMTEEIKVTIAAQACLLVVGLQEDLFFDHVLSILVYPAGYFAPNSKMIRGGVVIDGSQARLGEAWWRGPVILSWTDTLAGGRMEIPGRNLVFHEFAHQLDMLNGRICDGTPLLESTAQRNRWANVLKPEYEQLVQACQHGHHGFIDCYGATSPAEFFAVVTETFFERPQALRIHHLAVYEVLRDFYGLDPVTWLADDRPPVRHGT